MIRSIFLYLDRTYVIQSGGVRGIWDMGLQLFRTHIMSNSEIEKKSVSSLVELIEQERFIWCKLSFLIQCRRGETVDRSLLKNLLRMFVSLQVHIRLY